MSAEADEQDVDKKYQAGFSCSTSDPAFNIFANRRKAEKWSPRILCYEVCLLAS